MAKKIPMRSCFVCRTKQPKGALVRLVRSPDGIVDWDFTGKMPGRGAYVCKTPECLAKALEKERLANTLKVSLSQEEKQTLLEKWADHDR